jgi:hypothetical protein
MKQKNKLFTFIILFMSTTTFVAQLDKSNGTINKGKLKAMKVLKKHTIKSKKN